ncbi:hypothetical protein [Nakamurella lactea]|nr:hypothetical protein [Nakamurella lactea]
MLRHDPPSNLAAVKWLRTVRSPVAISTALARSRSVMPAAFVV